MINRRTFLAALATTPLAAAVPGNRIGCQMNAFKLSPDDFPGLLSRVSDLKRAGFSAFEVNVHFLEPQFSRPAEATAQIKNTGVRFYCAHTEFRLALDDLKKKADGAVTLGAGRLAVNGVVDIHKGDGPADPEELRKKIETLNLLGAHCHDAGIPLVYHNHGGEYVAGAQEMEEMLREISPENLAVLLDVGHALGDKADVPGFFSRHHQRIDGLHVHDMRGDKAPVYTRLAAAVKETGWSGWLILEAVNSKRDTNVEVALSMHRNLMRQTFGV